ncbi:MAG: hypothetical protein EXS10_02530 [Phycisphaerales bacterium]|nr:hypothetical protein [Phycisphaerales bacterium]
MRSLTHIPDAASAARLAAQSFARVPWSAPLFGEDLAHWRQDSRASLGLPLDVPIIVTGHQAGIWHAGIAEKFAFGSSIARALGGVLVHIVIDHDTNDASEVAFPAAIHGKLVRLHLERSPRERGVNALRSCVRVRRPEALVEEKARVLPRVDAALTAIEHAITQHATQPNLALQMAHAANALLPTSDAPSFTIAATDIARLPFAKAMRAHFDVRARDCYNFALGSERVRRLHTGELPFWRLLPETRGRVQLSTNDDDTLAAPRALTLTALVRLAIGDLFVHGTGGADYERATDRWLDAWLGVETTRAPIAVATATRFVQGLDANLEPLDPRATLENLRRLDADPFMGASLSSEKRAMLEKIASLPREEKTARFEAFSRMQESIRVRREVVRAERDALESALLRGQDATRLHALAFDRTWPFPLTHT